MKAMLPKEAFYKRGQLGPHIFMTDDDDALINALNIVWPEAKTILCVWHILQSTYRWVGARNLTKTRQGNWLKW